MKLCRFTVAANPGLGPRVGLMDDDGIRDVTAVTEELPTLRWPLPPGDLLLTNFQRLRPRIEALAANAPVLPRASVRLLSPVANPGKFILGVGNWHNMAPLGMLGFLLKVTSANAGEADGVQVRWTDRTTLHEPELAVVIGREGTNIPEDKVLDYVAGFTGGLDMTMKEEKEFFCFCKSFDTFGVLGPCIVTPDEIPDPTALTYKFLVNGEVKGERRFSDLTASMIQLVGYASTVMTLYPGDVIYSGATDVAPVVPGDMMTLEIPRIGRMDVAVSVSPHARGT